ncbi:hypothetical protein B296_00006213 [Ensete ventricosum]|uniref:RRM domain-containing protein n=1 Tax=Ensete ventricosum TaxID=4639 RepID=A0A427B195_ENSVE|nr:hypothetical protein B296_00006213 [Ensete ventricosum]
MEPLSSSTLTSGTSLAASAWEWGRLFVGGISSDTREETLTEHFERYGEVREVVVMRNRLTGSGRGFGFVQFANSEGPERALKEAKHVIHGRTVSAPPFSFLISLLCIVEVKRAIPRGEERQNQQCRNAHQDGEFSRSSRITGNSDNQNGSNINSKKIFIGGLAGDVTQQELKSYFEKFGSVVDTVVMYDSVTQRPRGFGFITFSSEEPVATVLKNRHHKLNGKLVEVKIAVPKDYGDCTSNRNSENYYNVSAFGGQCGRWPVYGTYQGYMHPYYGYPNYVTTPFSPYLYGGLYGGGYNNGGLYGIGHGCLLHGPRNTCNISKRMVDSRTYPPYFDRDFRSYDRGHGSDDGNENKGGPGVQTTVKSVTDSLVEAEDVNCDAQ